MPKAELHVVHVIPTVVGQPEGTMLPIADLLREGRVFLDRTTQSLHARFGDRVVRHLTVGSPTREILEVAAETKSDVIFVGAHNKGAVARLMLGSVSDYILKHAKCSVIVVRRAKYEAAPEIEPTCAHCVDVRRASNGEQMWCDAHSQHHVHGHVHYETPEPFAVGSLLIRPEG
jgi:nucleotide-binding universal stress UspA family protein